MTKRAYAEVIAAKVNGVVKEMQKANGVVFTGITWEGEKVAPIVYIDDFYKDEKSVDYVVERVLKAKEESMRETDFDMSMLETYEKVKPYLSARLYGKEKTFVDVSVSATEYGYDDLIIVPYVDIDLPNGKGSIRVNKDFLEKWGVSTETVIADALENVDYEIIPLLKMLSEIMGMMYDEEQEDDSDAVVVTNSSKSFGAIAVIKAKEELGKIFPDGYTVLPSSVHEVIVIGRQDPSFVNMVREINSTEVAPEEKLSDNAYEF